MFIFENTIAFDQVIVNCTPESPASDQSESQKLEATCSPLRMATDPIMRQATVYVIELK